MAQAEVLLFDFLKFYIIFGWSFGRRMPLLPVIGLRLPGALFTRGALHVPELLSDVTGGLDDGHQEIEYESIQEVEHDNDEKNLG